MHVYLFSFCFEREHTHVVFVKIGWEFGGNSKPLHDIEVIYIISYEYDHYYYRIVILNEMAYMKTFYMRNIRTIQFPDLSQYSNCQFYMIIAMLYCYYWTLTNCHNHFFRQGKRERERKNWRQFNIIIVLSILSQPPGAQRPPPKLTTWKTWIWIEYAIWHRMREKMFRARTYTRKSVYFYWHFDIARMRVEKKYCENDDTIEIEKDSSKEKQIQLNDFWCHMPFCIVPYPVAPPSCVASIWNCHSNVACMHTKFAYA